MSTQAEVEYFRGSRTGCVIHRKGCAAEHKHAWWSPLEETRGMSHPEVLALVESRAPFISAHKGCMKP